MAAVSKRQQARNERELNELLRLPDNAVCADCGARNPGWASWSLGVFLCMRCASIHRKLGTHISKVKSLTMDTWNSDQVENMKRTGNAAANKTYNPKNKRPDIPLDVDQVDSAMERFIRKKYQEKSLADGKPEPPRRSSVSRVVVPSRSPEGSPPPPVPSKKGRFFGFGLRASSATYPDSKHDKKKKLPPEPRVDSAWTIDSDSLGRDSRMDDAYARMSDAELQRKLKQLADMGFTETVRNTSVLRRLNGDVERTVEALVRSTNPFEQQTDTVYSQSFLQHQHQHQQQVAQFQTSSPLAQPAANLQQFAQPSALVPQQTGSPKEEWSHGFRSATEFLQGQDIYKALPTLPPRHHLCRKHSKSSRDLQPAPTMSVTGSARSAQSLLRVARRAALQPSSPSFLPRSYATVQSDIFKPTKYGGKYTVTLIPGDGIGAEVAEAVKTIFKADNVPVEWEQVDVSGLESGDKHSEDLFHEAIASLRRNKLGLKGILHTPIERSGHQSFNVALRQELDIYASVTLVKNIPGLETRHKDVDLCIVRENTEGEYSGLEHQSVSGVVESLKIITRAKSERIAKFAFSFALANNRKKVTCIHKANIMKLADGLFRSTVKSVGQDFPSIECNDMIVDNASMQCVSRPQQFDVLVMPNLYGGILTNIAAALVGGPGVVPGCNMGRDVAVFEPGCRHVGLDIQGKDQANPTALLLSGTMLLRHLGLDDHANRISRAVHEVIRGKKSLTKDMGGNATTHEFTRTVLDQMEKDL
ncbi:hypothetical protein DV738_g2570, partial [Chaetothyriales sp. CBS 135597]